MRERKPYKTDLSDEQWARIEPVIAAWKAAHPSVGGHQGRHAMREIVNALLYQSRTGCQWNLLPHDLPPRGAVMYYSSRWRDDGIDHTIQRQCGALDTARRTSVTPGHDAAARNARLPGGQSRSDEVGESVPPP
ncbi:transposase [Streptomyces sp. NPDC059371]|uniref:transposase n=1 Tax=Streptomyces sp. NPDC059371 TaxID=3346812 RepID=UPI0036A6290E